MNESDQTEKLFFLFRYSESRVAIFFNDQKVF